MIKKLLDEFLLDYLEANTSEYKKKLLILTESISLVVNLALINEKLLKENN